MNMGNKLIKGTAIAVALFLAYSSAVFAFRSAGPAVPNSLAQYHPAGGSDYDRFLGRALAGAAAQNKAMPDTLPSELIQIATAEFKSNPTAGNAVAIMAFAKKDEDRARLMGYAERLSKRNLAVNGWWIENYAKSNDLKAILGIYDRILRGSAGSQDAAIGALIASLARGEFVAPMTDMLAKNPPWAPQFWRAAIYDAKALTNVAAVRSALLDKKVKDQGFHDDVLISNLVNIGAYSEAETLYKRLAEADQVDGAVELVRNSDFTKPSKYFPFDWALQSDGDVSATIDAHRGTLELSSIGKNGKALARQLIANPRGRADIIVQFANGAQNFDRVQIRLYCASAQPATGLAFNPAKTREDYAVSLDGMACPYIWLEIADRTSMESGAFDTAIRQLSVRRN